MTTKLTESDFQKAANLIGVPVPTIKAVADVESAGGGFLPDGRVKVQYEPHVMYRQLKSHFNAFRAINELRKHPDLVALHSGSYQSAKKEDDDMDRAATLIDRDCALESASWGAFQIMGYHWSTIGYRTLQEFINDQYSATGQLMCFVKFILADSRLVQALRKKDWKTFARIYNGRGYASNKYDIKLAQAEARHRGA